LQSTFDVVRKAALPFLFAAAAALASCRPMVMTPKAQRVAIAPDTSAVGGCKLRGEVFALAPFRTSEEPVEQLKMRANGIGADTLVIVRDDGAQTAKDWKAKAYRCRGAGEPAEEEASAGGR
jgi:hypothetical protein